MGYCTNARVFVNSNKNEVYLYTISNFPFNCKSVYDMEQNCTRDNKRNYKKSEWHCISKISIFVTKIKIALS